MALQMLFSQELLSAMADMFGGKFLVRMSFHDGIEWHRMDTTMRDETMTGRRESAWWCSRLQRCRDSVWPQNSAAVDVSVCYL
jgi:hypothetical protein